MRVSYVIVTHDRRETLLATLGRLASATPLPPDQWEVIVVDNASADGTADAVRATRLPCPLRLIERPVNEGVAARNYGIEASRGAYVVLLDDDSYPVGDTLPRSIDWLDRRSEVGAIVGRAILPDGRSEACALPTVLISCAVMLRREALRDAGLFRSEFFRKAGEYDLSYRLWAKGWRVERDESLVYRHDKHLAGRSSRLAHKLDLRNNLILVERYLPRELRGPFRGDVIRRYAAIARSHGQGDVVREAIAEARGWASRERVAGRPETLDPATLEAVFGLERQREAVAAWADAQGVHRVALAGYAKHLWVTWAAARSAGLEVVTVADDGPAFAAMRYRDAPVVPLGEAESAGLDGVIVANVNPAQVDDLTRQVRAVYTGPVLRLWEPTPSIPLTVERKVA